MARLQFCHSARLDDFLSHLMHYSHCSQQIPDLGTLTFPCPQLHLPSAADLPTSSCPTHANRSWHVLPRLQGCASAIDNSPASPISASTTQITALAHQENGYLRTSLAPKYTLCHLSGPREANPSQSFGECAMASSNEEPQGLASASPKLDSGGRSAQDSTSPRPGLVKG